jgi:hypothetical protein
MLWPTAARTHRRAYKRSPCIKYLSSDLLGRLFSYFGPLRQ